MENFIKSVTMLVLLTLFFYPSAQIKVESTKSLPNTIVKKPTKDVDTISVKIDSLKDKVSEQINSLEETSIKYNKELKENMDFSKKINAEMISVVNKLSKKVDEKDVITIIKEIEKTENRTLVLDSVCVKKSGLLGTGRKCKEWELVLR